MANIEKISVGGTSYDVRDASAAHALTDIANAGNNITFTTPTIDDYSIQGSAVTVTSGIASGFTSDSFVYKSGIWNNVLNYNTFEFVTKFKLNSLSNRSPLGFVSASAYYNNFDLAVDSDGTIWFRFNDSTNTDRGVGTSGFSVGTGTDYWVKLVVVQASSVKIYTSTDGTNYTERASAEIPNNLRRDTADFRIGRGASKKPCLGSIDLTQTYFKDGDGNTIWAASALAGKPSINATVPLVDQTYNASSANAQSGVAINGAGFLKNESTSTTLGAQGLSIGGNNSTNGDNQVVVGYYAGQNTWSYSGGTVLPDSQNLSIGFGAGSMPYTTYGEGNIAIGYLANSVDGILGLFTGYTVADHTNCIAIGSLAHAYSTNGIAIGSSEDGTTTNATEARTYSIAIGTNTKALANNGIAIGRNSSAGSNYSTAVGYQASTTATSSLALGRNAEASASYAIQLGRGTNNTANTFNVGLSSSDNYTLLNSDGTIPAGRLTNAIQGAITSTTVTLTSAGWSSNTQTVNVTGMTASSVVWVSPVGASMADYASGGVYCSGQASGTLTFTCSTAPSSDLTVQVVFG